MKPLTGLPARWILIVSLGCFAAFAQVPDDGVRGAQGTIRNGMAVSESFLVAGPGLQMSGPVTGQPYSAEQVSQHSQTLLNGTHIKQNREMARMYRDSEGRTRTERRIFLGPVGKTGTNDARPKMIHIYDPVEGYSYTLDTQKQIAHRFTIPKSELAARPARTARLSEPAPLTQQGLRKPVVRDGALPQRQIKQETLGTEMIDGIQAEGTRVTMTTPAGVEGNDRPLTRVCEHWQSVELKIVMLSKCSDSRTGNTTLRVQSLDRTEPDPALFQIPADYTMVEETGPFAVRFTQGVQR